MDYEHIYTLEVVEADIVMMTDEGEFEGGKMA